MKQSIALLTLTMLAALPGRIEAQTNDATIQALLAEVRLLRIALERSAITAPKIQSILWRMQWQQEVVSRLSGQLEGLRQQMDQPLPDFDLSLKMAEQAIPPEQRKMMEEEFKKNKARFEQERAQQRVREVELSSRLQTEQAKLSELNDRLDSLEKTLEGPPAK
jgi:hypothetical protein